jgi:hypothetical protein
MIPLASFFVFVFFFFSSSRAERHPKKSERAEPYGSLSSGSFFSGLSNAHYRITVSCKRKKKKKGVFVFLFFSFSFFFFGVQGPTGTFGLGCWSRLRPSRARALG